MAENAAVDAVSASLDQAAVEGPLDESEPMAVADVVAKICHLCTKQFLTREGLFKHLTKKHKIDTTTMRNDLKYQFDCFHESCRVQNIRMKNIAEYREHLEAVHSVAGITIPTKLVFDNAAQLHAWKTDLELKDMSKFVTSRSVKRLKYCTIWHYECNRSGKYRGRGTGKRRLKAQGSCKTGNRCPATLVIIKKDGRYYVTYHAMHYGHEKTLSHLNLTATDRQKIANQLAEGVPMEKVLQNIRLSVDSDFNRSHLLTRKDLHNIRKAFGIKSGGGGSGAAGGGATAGVFTADGVIVEPAPAAVEPSVGLHGWVETMQVLGEDSPILRFSEHAEALGAGGDNDFLLILMNPLQRKMFQKFGKDRVAIDTTYGSAPGFDFELTTLLVVDDYEEGFPVAFMLASALTNENLLLFFSCVKEAVGDMKPFCLMSDDASAFYNAWASVMGPVVKRQLYTQHVDRTAAKDRQDGSGVVMETVDYRQAVDKALRGCHGELKDIKHAHMVTGSLDMVDKCIEALFSFVLDKQFNRLTKLHQGKVSAKLASMVQAHAEGASLAPSCFAIDALRWQIPSASVPNRSYLVERTEAHECTRHCAVVCRQCFSCLANMSCTCDDYQILGNMCKHIHAAGMNALEQTTGTPAAATIADPVQVISVEAKDETQFYVSTLKAKLKTQRQNSIQAIAQEITALSTFDKDMDQAVLQGVMTYMQAAKGLLVMKRTEESATKLSPTAGRRELMSSLCQPQYGTPQYVVHVQPKHSGGEPGANPVGRPRKNQKILPKRAPRQLAPVGHTDVTAAMVQQVGVGGNAILVNQMGGGSYLQQGGMVDTKPQIVLVSKPQDLTLSLRDQLAIRNGEALTDIHMECAFFLLKKQFAHVAGLESTLLCQTEQGFTLQNDNAALVVQVHHTGDGGHWVTSTRAAGDDSVAIYDSKLALDPAGNPVMSYALQQQLAQIYRLFEKEIRVSIPEMCQSTEADCGLYALATAADLCHGNDPSKRLYDVASLRLHLLKCYQQQNFAPFPATGVERDNAFYGSIRLYCYCHGLGDDNMVECEGCLESFHCACVEYIGGDFRCAGCRATKMDMV